MPIDGNAVALHADRHGITHREHEMLLWSWSSALPVARLPGIDLVAPNQQLALRVDSQGNAHFTRRNRDQARRRWHQLGPVIKPARVATHAGVVLPPAERATVGMERHEDVLIALQIHDVRRRAVLERARRRQGWLVCAARERAQQDPERRPIKEAAQRDPP